MKPDEAKFAKYLNSVDLDYLQQDGAHKENSIDKDTANGYFDAWTKILQKTEEEIQRI